MSSLRIIAGSGRSGTTWILDNLAAANNLRPVFEPLHPSVSTIGNQFAYRALRPGESHPDLEAFLRKACFSGHKSLWTTYRGRPDLLFPDATKLFSLDELKRLRRRWVKFLGERPQLAASSRRPHPIAKFIRANLMLGWLRSVFDCGVVLVVRHPGAVVESQLRLGSVWNPQPVLDRYRSDERLDAITSGRYRTLLRSKLSPVQALTLAWVIENQWPLENCASDGVTPVFYEHLRAPSGTGWRLLCRALGLSNVPAADELHRPSQQSSVASRNELQGDPGRKPGWRDRLAGDQLRDLQGVLDDVGFEIYHVERAEPRVADAAAVSLVRAGSR